MSDTIRLFIGAAADDCDLESQAVAEWTARKYCSLPLEIVWMQQAKTGPYSGWDCARNRTPFSGFRWSLPAMCAFSGRAIYTDVDFIFRADLAELWNQPIPGVLLAKKSRKPGGKIKTCCMLIDCAKAKRHIADLAKLKRMSDPQGFYTRHFQQHQDGLVGQYEGDWNAIDLGDYAIDDPRVKAIHYSRIETQPVLAYSVPRLKAEGRSHWYTGEIRTHWRQDVIDLFDAELKEAIANGYTLDRYRTEFVGLMRRDFKYTAHRGTAKAS